MNPPRRAELFPDWQLRLFRPDEARWGGGDVHESVRFEGKVHRLAGTLEHFADPTCGSRIAKFVPYGDLFLLGQLEKGRRRSLLANVFRPFWRFVRAYFLKLGFLDGLPGLYLAQSPRSRPSIDAAGCTNIAQTPRTARISIGGDRHPIRTECAGWVARQTSRNIGDGRRRLRPATERAV